MRVKLSLTQRYTVFLSGVTLVLLAASYFVTLRVSRDGFSELFRSRLERSRAVVEQYARVDVLVRRKELETIVTSPRFVAALATGDSATISHEAPTYQALARADLFAVGDPFGELLYGCLDGHPSLSPSLHAVLLDAPDRLEPTYVLDSSELFQVAGAPVITADGVLIGRVVVGHRVLSYLPDDLKQLTGFDVLVTCDGQVVGHTDSPPCRRLAASPEIVNAVLHAQNRIEEITLAGETGLVLTIPLRAAAVTFVALVDEHIAPIMSKVSQLLIFIGLLGGLLAVSAIYYYTQRRIGRQVDLLVGAAHRMATDDFDFEIIPASQDELGFLAGEFERMRARVLANRGELQVEHEARLSAERLATVGRLTAGIVHDFKNPMAIIRSGAELIQMRAGDDKALHRRAGLIQDQVDRMSELTRELLEYSRGESKLELSPVDIQDYLPHVAEAHREICDRSGLTVSVEGNTPAPVMIDPYRFRRVIDNLLNNAREALKPGRRITLGWSVDGERVALSVVDDGPGIPPAILESLFDPFVTHGKEGGTGLGLAIARRIVEDHGGRISVHSAPGEGATFTIELPRAGRESVRTDRTAVGGFA